MTVNGEAVALEAPDTAMLLDVLRNTLGLTWSRFGCGAGACGSCIVLVDGAAQPSCTLPFWAVADKAVETIEGLGTPERPHTLQTAVLGTRSGATGMAPARVAAVARPCSELGQWQPRSSGRAPSMRRLPPAGAPSDRTAVTSDSWDASPILWFSEVPRVSVHILPSAAPSVGAGEASVDPTAAAIGNAVAAALRVRARPLPLSAERIVAAFDEEQTMESGR